MTPLDLEKIDDSTHLLDILIQCETVLDSLDCWIYKNWFSGEVVEGPIVSRYWVKISLLYPFDKMPDPRAALRLLKHGVLCEFDRVEREGAKPVSNESEPKKPDEWLVRVSFPRRLLDQNEETDLEVYDDEVNSDDVEDAEDTGLDDESSLHADEQIADPNQMQEEPPAPRT